MNEKPKHHQGVKPDMAGSAEPGQTCPGYALELGQRIELAAGQVGGKKALAEKTQIRESSLYRYINGSNTPGLDKAMAIAHAAGVSLNWLATGEGEMLETGKARNAMVSAVSNGVSDGPADGYVSVPYYDVQAAAGGGALVGDEQIASFVAFREDWIRSYLRAVPGRMVLMDALGDSMAPHINDGDKMLVELEPVVIMEGKVHVLRVGDSLKVKRLQKLRDGTLILHSDNKQYESERIPAEDQAGVHIVGRVHWAGRLF